jgi:hypothetical protein
VRWSTASAPSNGSAFHASTRPLFLGRLLGPDAGHWQIAPAGESTSTRRYVDRTLALETTFTTASGVVVLTDMLGLGPDNGGHRLGVGVPHLLVRRLTCTSGRVVVDISYAPRPEYGLVVPLLAHVDGGVTARHGGSVAVVVGPAPGVASLEPRSGCPNMRQPAQVRSRRIAAQADHDHPCTHLTGGASVDDQQRTIGKPPPERHPESCHLHPGRTAGHKSQDQQRPNPQCVMEARG